MNAILLTAALAAVSAPQSEAALVCEPPPGWDEITSENPRYIVFGETHGIAQGPELVGAVACSLAAQGERILVGLELSATDNEALQSAWHGPHAQFAEALLRTMPDWKQRNDGVTSEAVLALLVRLHALKKAGRAIDVVAFNGMRDEAQRARFADLPAQGPHDAAQAENIRNAGEAGRYDRVLVLVGSLHARKQPKEMQGIAFAPMAMKLAPADRVLSLELTYGKGEGWNCQLREGASFAPGQPIAEGDISCAVHPQAGRKDMSGEPHVAKWPKGWANERDLAFDGYAWVGLAQASPPAIEAAGERQ